MYTPDIPQIGDKVIILFPDYVSEKAGKVCGREKISEDPMRDRWLIEISSDNFVVSLYSHEFRVVR
ncbi:hypothetical protein ACQ4M4_24475 [Leptolyngbya sp. AN02str]|uniref:hypothetical protein n=1 Tax=Leptolyngbya sp. AN02str TaxID=3423363 RepID=UPI003D320CFD